MNESARRDVVELFSLISTVKITQAVLFLFMRIS